MGIAIGIVAWILWIGTKRESVTKQKERGKIHKDGCHVTGPTHFAYPARPVACAVAGCVPRALPVALAAQLDGESGKRRCQRRSLRSWTRGDRQPPW